MKATSIINDGRISYQSNFTYPSEHDTIAHFEDYCLLHDAKWSKLFKESDGTHIASYDCINGLEVVK